MSARDPYFAALQKALSDAHGGHGLPGPALVIDRRRLNANIDRAKASVPAGLGLRVVAKSLPSPELLDHVLKRLQTDRLMVFNLPMLEAAAARWPEADLLLGKPLTAAALRAFLQKGGAPGRVQWLIDAPARLDQYEALAEAAGAPLRIALELDVGLRRGGFGPGPDLRAALERLRDSARLSFSGFMGYEPHLAALPKLLGWRERAREAAWARYRAALDLALAVFGDGVLDRITRNAGGSPTFRLYRHAGPANEIALGSALVKPSDFDLDGLMDFEPASFIATPVLKSGPTRLPGLERLGPALRALTPGKAWSVFIHGGNWLADPVDPSGYAPNRVFGHSSNQEMLSGPAQPPLSPDDLLFLRPRQSEAVLLQFGDLMVVEDGAVVARWPVLPPSA